MESGSLRCPWHHACFDLATGAATAAPAFDSLPRYAVEVSARRFSVRPAQRPSTPPKSAFHPVPIGGAMTIIGGGAAGFAAANALRRGGWRGAVTLICEESAQPYDRTLLSKDYLDGHFGDERLPIARHSLADIGVRFEPDVTVEFLDAHKRIMRLKDGRTKPYGTLLLATGAAPRRLDVAGADLPHVFLLRSLADCDRILSHIETGQRVAIVGGSFIALEAAASLRSRGLSIDVVAPDHHPMEKVLGRVLSELIVDVHRKNGVTLHLGSTISRIESDAVMLDSGEILAADLVLVGIGVEPRLDLAKAAGLQIEGGITVDSRLRTSVENVFAAGDIACWPDPHSGKRIRVEHWVVAQRQGEIAAANMLGADQPFEMVPFFWTKHFDLAIRYVGHAPQWDEIAVEGDVSRRDATVNFRSHGRDLAVATVGRDRESLRAELAMEQQLDRCKDNIGRGSA